MLVLSRNAGQKIVIDGRTTVTIQKIIGDKVFLAIDAPTNVRVDREEVHERRMQEVSSGTSDALKLKVVE